MEKNEVKILIYTFTIILLALGIFLLLFYFLFKKKQEAHRKRIIALNQELLKTQIEIQEQTLKNVSQEIHDNIGQVLSLVKLNLNTFPVINNEGAMESITYSRELVSKVITDLRDLTRSMHGETIAEIGLQNAVEHELKILKHTGRFITHLTITGEPYKLNPHTQMVIFRIVQEAMHNEIKHSKAKNIYINFEYSSSSFNVRLKDDGIGFDLRNLPAGKKGIGLRSMQSRAALVGGEFLLNSSPDNGTEIVIKIPAETPDNI